MNCMQFVHDKQPSCERVKVPIAGCIKTLWRSCLGALTPMTKSLRDRRVAAVLRQAPS